MFSISPKSFYPNQQQPINPNLFAPPQTTKGVPNSNLNFPQQQQKSLQNSKNLEQFPWGILGVGALVLGGVGAYLFFRTKETE